MMSTHKRLVLLVALCALLVTAAGFLVATQYAAWALHYQRQLGLPLAAYVAAAVLAVVAGTVAARRFGRPGLFPLDFWTFPGFRPSFFALGRVPLDVEFGDGAFPRCSVGVV
jgi:hypothetical protein